MTSARLAALLLCSVLGFAHAAAAAGQEPQEPADARGWIGISFRSPPPSAVAAPRGAEPVEPPAPGTAPRPSGAPVVVAAVFRGSPAHRAGIRRGDTIRAVDGEPVDLEMFRTLGPEIRAGDRIRLTLGRDGERRETVVVAESRPVALTAPPSEVEVKARLDSLRERVLRHLDSLQRRMLAGGPPPRPGPVTRITEPPAPSEEPAAGRAQSFSPHLVGRNWVAGARFLPLDSGLAEAFRVEDGLLVTAVIEGGPAAAAGLRPGDVLRGVDGKPSRTIGQLRAVLAARAEGGAELTVIREGEQITVRLGTGG